MGHFPFKSFKKLNLYLFLVKNSCINFISYFSYFKDFFKYVILEDKRLNK